MIRFQFFLAVLFCFFIIGCSNSESLKQTSPKQTIQPTNNLRRYAVGKGGGFTGVYEEYILAEDGKVFKRDFNYDREVFIKQLSPVDVNYFIEQLELLGIEGESIDEPGNMNYYIEIREGKLSVNKVLWGSNAYNPPNKLVDFHKELFKKLAELE
ncbi:MAG: hypothetical protein J5I47_02320 [Vicingus serpentipes]|nr:hypothetical protein [Vicingus serpentipes]